MKKFVNVDGNTACSSMAYKMSEVIEIYPITPSSTMAENADEMAVAGQKNVFGQEAMIKEMQSEAGVAGAVHGSLSAGVLATTFTSSQGLLLMLPNMLKIAGEMLPCVFHVSARALATHALSIFGDHSDVMAVRSSGFNMLCSNNVQEAQDLALVAHLAALKSSLPFVHFFDGFRTSHEVQKIEAIEDEDIKKIFPYDEVEKFRERRLDPLAPVQRGTAQNPDIFFQNREAGNVAQSKVFACVESAMADVKAITGREYHAFEYVGAKDAESILVMMGSGAEAAEETINYLNQCGQKFGLVKVRLFRPFNGEALKKVIPETAKNIVVLDRCKEVGAVGEPLYVDVCAVMGGMGLRIIGGRFGLGGKEFDARCAKAVFDNVQKSKPINGFTVGIKDDVTHLSLPLDEKFELQQNGYAMKFYGLGSDGTVSANKNSIKIIGAKTDKFVQGYFEYDSKKSGSMTISHLRVSDEPIKATYLVDKADFVAIHNYSFVARYDILESLKEGGVVLLNTVLDEKGLSKDLPAKFALDLKKKNAKLYIIDGNAIAAEQGLGNKINTIMQSAFFKISGILEEGVVMAELEDAIKKTYGRKGDKVVEANVGALKKGAENLVEVDVSALKGRRHKKSKETTDKYFLEIIEPVNNLKGSELPVSAFSPDGTVPTGTTKFEKRGIGEKCPDWKSEKCIQCGLCSLACPHAALRANLFDKKTLKKAPNGFETVPANAGGKGEYRLQVSPLDCTGCGLCANVCPTKALEMVVTTEILDRERENHEFAKSAVKLANPYPINTPKWLQFEKSYFEYSYACPGCGETPYIRLATTLFGNKMVIANATGCSSIYGGSAPACPYAKDENGCGPAWANSLFEDNAEFGYGIYLGIKHQKDRLKGLAGEVVARVGDGDLQEVAEGRDIAKENADKLCERLLKLAQSKKLDEKQKDIVKQIVGLKPYMSQKSVWIVGGDGWAYDIGFGGLDHVLASGENVNILVLDTEVYSNTGGQSSKSTPSGAYAKFAASGKASAKKDLGAMAMTYQDVYVAQIALGANPVQAINAFREAEAHKGVSLIIAYAPCINHGIDMSRSYHEMKKAVDTGYWNLYRRRPAGEGQAAQLLVDSTPTADYQDFLDGESRFKALKKQDPERAEKLFRESEADAKARRAELLDRAD